MSANLLYTAIIANTLNFRASVSTERDIKAALELSAISTLPNNWVERYYNEVAEAIFTNPVRAIANDTKRLEIKGQHYLISQLELWDARPLIRMTNVLEICYAGLNIAKEEKVLPWLVNIASIKDGYNYLVTDSDEMRLCLVEKLNARFNDNLYGICERLWLRKEIMAEL